MIGAVSVYDANGKFIKECKNHTLASRATGVSQATISNILNGKRKPHRKFGFKNMEMVHLQGERWKELTEDPRFWISNMKRVVTPKGVCKSAKPGVSHFVGIIIKYRVTQEQMYKKMWQQ